MICLAVNVTVDLIVGVTVSWVSQLTQGDLLLRNSKGCRHTKGWIFFGGKRAVYLNRSSRKFEVLKVLDISKKPRNISYLPSIYIGLAVAILDI